jgi:hypothetical protein
MPYTFSRSTTVYGRPKEPTPLRTLMWSGDILRSRVVRWSDQMMAVSANQN